MIKKRCAATNCLALVVDSCSTRTHGKTIGIKRVANFLNKLQKTLQILWGWKVHFALRPLVSKHRVTYVLILASSHHEFTTESNLCNFNLCLIWVISTLASLRHSFYHFFWLMHTAAVYSHGCQWISEDEDERYEEERQRLPEVMRRLNSMKNLLYKTNYFSKESFHQCAAAGPCAITWLCVRVRLFVFIMRRAAMNAWDDLFFLLFLCLPLMQLICKYKVIATQLWRFELK